MCLLPLDKASVAEEVASSCQGLGTDCFTVRHRIRRCGTGTLHRTVGRQIAICSQTRDFLSLGIGSFTPPGLQYSSGAVFHVGTGILLALLPAATKDTRTLLFEKAWWVSVLLSIPDERLTSGETVKFCRERLEHKSEDTTISVSFCSLETLPVLLLDEPEFRARVAISEATRCGIVSTRALAKGLRALPTLASDRATQGQSH